MDKITYPHKYRPSNGTEGMAFISRFCENCIHEHPHPDHPKKCSILSASMLYDVDEIGYPSEWQSIDPTTDLCTSFVKWDWDNNGDPDDPDNPLAPIPVAPNQLCFPFELESVSEVSHPQVDALKFSYSNHF